MYFFFNDEEAGGLVMAAGYYAADQWGEDEWLSFGRETGTTDIIKKHDRLLRSWSFGDPDYTDACIAVMGQILKEGPDPQAGQAGKMDLLKDSMPDLPGWIRENGPGRARRLFREYISARANSEIPKEWLPASTPTTSTSAGKPEILPKELDGLNSGSVPTQLENSSQSGPDVNDKWDSVNELADKEPAPREQVVSTYDPTSSPREVFIVHGHDIAAVNSLKVFIQERFGVMPTNLQNAPGIGRTIIEKFEDSGSRVDIAVILLTPDDIGAAKAAFDNGEEPHPRARQNVVLEMGYFIARVGRSRVVVLNGGVELPSDVHGVSYIPYPGDSWKDDLFHELKSMGLVASSD
ncbi:nucleotide-binding protein [Micrococcus luteus]|uniref:TIR domain-containing protein n=1 Tax=Micrococcus luteus TaxID=1270 RepID=UPI00147AD500|nr:nucleotide-binding protein [Micrococcus luteus]